MEIIKGIAGAPGLAKADAYFYRKNISKTAVVDIDEAVKISLEKIEGLKRKAENSLGEGEAKIFEAYKMLLEDRALISQIRSRIEDGDDAVSATEAVTGRMSAILASKKNEYMRQRADDIRYVGKLICESLCGAKQEDDKNFEGKVILAAYELTPVDTMLFDLKNLAAIVTETGGATSHTVILAKSLGIPAVTGVENIEKRIKTGSFLCVDGNTGKVTVDPGKEQLAEFEMRLEEERNFIEKIKSLKKSKAYLRDGEEFNVCVNIGNPEDLNELEETVFNGVGLFRTEFLYSKSQKKPTFEQQAEAYKKVIDFCGDEYVTIRTIDVGGDKIIDYLNMKKEENPFLGSRGIRLSMDNGEIFLEQLCAILYAARGKKVKILLPMITSVKELDWAKDMIKKAEERLSEKNLDFCRNYLVGIMIETPACAVCADMFAKKCDFFSIGTNDLVQYITAADRGNVSVAKFYNPYHLAVLRLIDFTAKSAVKNGISVSVCGDLAANLDFTEIFVGMGINSLSVPAMILGRVKKRLGEISEKEAAKTLETVLSSDDGDKIEGILKKGERK